MKSVHDAQSPGPAFGDRMVSVERAVHDRGPYFQHQMSAPRRGSTMPGGPGRLDPPSDRPLGGLVAWWLGAARCLNLRKIPDSSVSHRYNNKTVKPTI